MASCLPASTWSLPCSADGTCMVGGTERRMSQKVELKVTSVHGRIQDRNGGYSFGKTFALPVSRPESNCSSPSKNYQV